MVGSRSQASLEFQWENELRYKICLITLGHAGLKNWPNNSGPCTGLKRIVLMFISDLCAMAVGVVRSWNECENTQYQVLWCSREMKCRRIPDFSKIYTSSVMQTFSSPHNSCS